MPKPPAIEGVDRFVGRGLPAIRIGDGSRTLVSLPGLSLDERHPTGQARTMALAGWEPLLDRYTIYRVGRRQYPIGTTFRQMADDVITAIEGLRAARRPDGGVNRRDHRAGDRGRAPRPGAPARARHQRDDGESGLRAISPSESSPPPEPASGGARTRLFLPIGARSGPERLFYRAFGWLLGPGLVGVPSDPTLMIAELEAWLRSDGSPLVRQVASPTLVLAGELDPVFPLEGARAFAAGFADGRLVVMPRTAHDLPASAIRDHISGFLDEDPGPTGV